jgi:hypothetical protein
MWRANASGRRFPDWILPTASNTPVTAASVT